MCGRCGMLMLVLLLLVLWSPARWWSVRMSGVGRMVGWREARSVSVRRDAGSLMQMQMQMPIQIRAGTAAASASLSTSRGGTGSCGRVRKRGSRPTRGRRKEMMGFQALCEDAGWRGAIGVLLRDRQEGAGRVWRARRAWRRRRDLQGPERAGAVVGEISPWASSARILYAAACAIPSPCRAGRGLQGELHSACGDRRRNRGFGVVRALPCRLRNVV